MLCIRLSASADFQTADPGLSISHILGGEIVFYHAPVAFQQGCVDCPLRIFRSGQQGQILSEVSQGRMLP